MDISVPDFNVYKQTNNRFQGTILFPKLGQTEIASSKTLAKRCCLCCTCAFGVTHRDPGTVCFTFSTYCTSLKRSIQANRRTPTLGSIAEARVESADNCRREPQHSENRSRDGCVPVLCALHKVDLGFMLVPLDDIEGRSTLELLAASDCSLFRGL